MRLDVGTDLIYRIFRLDIVCFNQQEFKKIKIRDFDQRFTKQFVITVWPHLWSLVLAFWLTFLTEVR